MTTTYRNFVLQMKKTVDEFLLLGCSYKLLRASFAFLVMETSRASRSHG